MNEVEKAWLAGIIDGEGCIVPRRAYGNGKHVCRLMISNTDPGILSEVRRLYAQLEVFYSEQVDRYPNRKDCYRIEINRTLEVPKVLSEVRPYLKHKEKIEKCDLVTEYVAEYLAGKIAKKNFAKVSGSRPNCPYCSGPLWSRGEQQWVCKICKKRVSKN